MNIEEPWEHDSLGCCCVYRHTSHHLIHPEVAASLEPAGCQGGRTIVIRGPSLCWDINYGHRYILGGNLTPTRSYYFEGALENFTKWLFPYEDLDVYFVNLA